MGRESASMWTHSMMRQRKDRLFILLNFFLRGLELVSSGMLRICLERRRVEREDSDIPETKETAWASDFHVALAHQACPQWLMRSPTSDYVPNIRVHYSS